MAWPDKLPNKCDHCGLRVRYDFRSGEESTSSDAAFGELRHLHAKKIIKPYYRRVVGASNVNPGSTEFCAVSEKAWQLNEKPCKHWILRIHGGTVTDYLSLHNDGKSLSAAWWVGIGAIGATILMGVVAIAATFIAS